jgi:hypothetical protein
VTQKDFTGCGWEEILDMFLLITALIPLFTETGFLTFYRFLHRNVARFLLPRKREKFQELKEEVIVINCESE